MEDYKAIRSFHAAHNLVYALAFVGNRSFVAFILISAYFRYYAQFMLHTSGYVLHHSRLLFKRNIALIHCR